MSDIQLFSCKKDVKKLKPTKVLLEKQLQNTVEENMEEFFGVRFIKSEYIISNGRMDSIGIDENNSPVIFEYKRSQNENVINQGLYYLDWLLDHKADFKELVRNKFGEKLANTIDWSVPSVICIAHEFTKYDEHAVNQMGRNIKLVKYQQFDEGLILFEHLNVPQTKVLTTTEDTDKKIKRTHLQKLDSANKEIQTLYYSVCDFIESLGDDISENQLKFYKAYKKIKNIVCVEIHENHISMFLKISPDSITLEKGFTRDMRKTGHYGTGDVQVIIKNANDFEKAKNLIIMAYNEGN